MRSVAGQLFRLGGLLIELLGVAALLVGRGGAARVPLPGGEAIEAAWVAIVSGFVLWMIGTALVFAARRRPAP